MSKQTNGKFQRDHSNLPIAKNEDVEFSTEVADEADLEALERAQEADSRQQES